MRIAIAFLVLALTAGCAVLPGAQPTPVTTDAPAPSEEPPATNAPAVTPAPTRTGSADEPPAGLLTLGQATTEGWLGTYCWQSACVDVPVTPQKSALPALSGSADELAFALAGGAPFVEWSAFYSETANGDVTKLGEGGVFDPDTGTEPPLLTQVTFPPPPPGDWVLLFSWYGPAGDAAYAWHLVVE